MEDDAIAQSRSFSRLAKSRGVSPNIPPMDGARTLELLSLIEEAEDLGNQILGLLGPGKHENKVLSGLLERLLECYREPKSYSKKLTRIRSELKEFIR
jgi:hypothetical protein